MAGFGIQLQQLLSTGSLAPRGSESADLAYRAPPFTAPLPNPPLRGRRPRRACRASRTSYGNAGGGAGGRRWSESSNHSSMTYSRRISAVGTIFESPHISVGTQVCTVRPGPAPKGRFGFCAKMYQLLERRKVVLIPSMLPLTYNCCFCIFVYRAQGWLARRKEPT